MSLEIVVVYGSVRRDRQGIKAARFITQTLEARGHKVTLVDPIEYELPMLDLMYKQYQPEDAPEAMRKLSEIYFKADAFVFVSGEYNHSIPAALKNLIDHFQKEYFWRPAGIVTYSAGPFGGARVGPHLRVILGELGMVTLPTMFAVSKVGASFDDDGKPIDDAYPRRAEKFMKELEWYANALGEARKAGVPYE